MEKMYVNEKSYEVIKLLGHGKGGYSFGSIVYALNLQTIIQEGEEDEKNYYEFACKGYLRDLPVEA